MRDPLKRGLVWPQRLRVALGYDDSRQGAAGRRDQRDIVGRGRAAVGLARRATCCRAAAGSATGCSSWTRRAATICCEHIEDIPDALTRGSAWVTLWDNLLEARVRPGALLDAALRALAA